jgi:hypothetical protein
MDKIKQPTLIKKMNNAIIWPGVTLASGVLLVVIIFRSKFNFNIVPYMYEEIVHVKRDFLYHAAFISQIINILIYRSLLNFMLL